MPLFRFRCRDGARDFFDTEIELADRAAARAEAVRFSAEIMRDDPDGLWSTGQLRVEVTDEAGSLLWSVITLAIETPGASVTPAKVLGGA